MKKNYRRLLLQFFRVFVQIGFFVLLPGLFVTVFSGIKQIYTGIVSQKFSLAENLPQLIGVITVIPMTILMGRFFCGWMCGFGAFNDFLYKISNKGFKGLVKINEKTDRALKYLKYVILIFLVVVIWNAKTVNLSAANPWNVFGILATVYQVPDIKFAFSEFTIGFFILLVISIGALLVERFFCRYLCPLGAAFAIMSKLRLAKIKKPSDKCGACRVCTNSCAMGIRMYKYDKISSGECINCLKCVSVCPRKNVKLSIANEDVRSGIAAAVTLTCMTGFYYVGSYAAQAESKIINNDSKIFVSARNPKANLYANGTFEGSGTGFRGATTTVSVTTNNDVIKEIKLVSDGDDPQYFNTAYNPIVNHILSTQSADVDAVSGATFSSRGIMEAVSNALENAKLALSTPVSVNGTEQDKASKINETGEPASVLSSNPSTDSQKSSTNTTSITSKYKDGTYEGSARGYRRGITTVSVAVKNDKIIDVSIISNGDSPQFFDSASGPVISEILDMQSANVDAVSGATYSSMGIMNAVADALSKAEV